MPIYIYKCVECQTGVEALRSINGENPDCSECGQKMEKQLTFPVMVKIKGMGGYPSRRKMINDTAPYSSK